MPYIGRFAPSPSGPLHMGSLVCAVASFLDAKANHGQWLVRIEDIDPPREQQGASEQIIECLALHGMESDAQIMYQSTRGKAYQRALDSLAIQKLSYRCNCTRKRLAQLEKSYDNHCRNAPPSDQEPAAIRLNLSQASKTADNVHSTVSFEDLVQGVIKEALEDEGDFTIHRKDGLFAYQLAVVVDDIQQGITHIVRGSDLLETTSKQIFLTNILNGTPCTYAHIPVLNHSNGLKLSKQNHAPALDLQKCRENLIQTLNYLNHPLPPNYYNDSISSILNWAIEHWSIQQIPHQRSLSL